MFDSNKEEEKDLTVCLSLHITCQGYHLQPLIHIIRNIHIRIHTSHLPILIFFDLDLLLSDGSGRVIAIIVVWSSGGIICRRYGSETTKGVVRNPCEIEFANVGNVEGLVKEGFCLVALFEG